MELFDRILHSLSFGLAKIVDMFMEIFYFFAGVTDINGNMITASNGIGNDFLTILFGTRVNGSVNSGPKITMTTIFN